MKKFIFFPIIFFLVTILFFFRPFFFENKLPIPTDTIVGLYFPFRDAYAKEYPRGIPFKNFQITDPVRQQYPWKLLTIDEFKNFQLPLWNPYNFSGTPLLANFQSGVFYPLNFLFLVLPFHIGWSVNILLQPFIAMIFMYLFLKNLKLSSASGIFGALSFAFCGFFVSWMEWGNVMSTGLWLPLILLGIDKLFYWTNDKNKVSFKIKLLKFDIKIKNYSLWKFVLLTALTSSFFAGHLQVFFYAYILSLLYFLVRWIQFGKDKKILSAFLLLNALYFLFTAIQWLPTLQFILSSARDLDQDWHNPGWFIPWQNLAQFIAPDFFGNPSTLNYWGVWNYGEFIGYIGFFPFLLAIYAAFFSKRKIVWFFSLIFIASLLFALPTLLAKIPFKFSLPFLSTSQPTRLLFLADISLSILAAFGLEYFLRNKKQIFFPIIFVGGLILICWLYVLYNPFFPDFVKTSQENLVVTANNIKLPTLLFGSAVMLFVFYLFFEKRLKYARQIFLIAVLLVTIFDLYRFTTKYITFAEKQYLFPDTKIISFLQQQPKPFRVIATDSRVFPPNFSIIYKIETPDGYDPLYTRQYAELSAATSRGEPNIVPPFGFNRIITIQNYRSTKMLNLLNVKYILSLVEIEGKDFKKISKEGETILYENTAVFPRSFFVEEILPVSKNQEAIDALFDENIDLSLKAVVRDYHTYDGDEKFVLGKVKEINHSENRVLIQTENAGEGFLVLTDSYYPTWHAKVCSEDHKNCKETPIYVTDYNFRGIIVPPGNHSIEFYNTLL